jgi:quaternary ammonium compound-resistance protein SugE
MAWVYLVLAGLFEIAWALGLKASAGFTRLGPMLLSVIAIVASLGLLTLSLRTIPIGTAYAAWTGIGIVGTVVIGIAAHGEPINLQRIIAIALILVGVAALKLTS